MEIFVLYTIMICGALYQIIFRKKSDFLTISFFGMILYFSPGLIGYVNNPYYPKLLPSVPMLSETYYVFFIALFFNLAFSVISDFRSKEECGRNYNFIISSKMSNLISAILIITFVMSFIESGKDLFSPDKSIVLESRGRALALFSVVAQISFFIGVVKPDKIITPLSIIFMALLVYIGFRSYFAITIIAIISRFIFNRSIRSLFNPFFASTVIALGLFILFYKQFYIFIKLGRFDLAADRLNSDGLLYTALFSSEPFMVQFTLNEVIKLGYTEPLSKIIVAPLLLIPGLTQIVGISSDALNFDFQTKIMPILSFGAGSNIYAHWYATSAWLGIIIFSVIHNIVLIWLSSLTKRLNGIFSATIFLIGSFLSFYIIRNDMFYTMSVIERYLVVGIILVILDRFITRRSSSIT